MLRDDDKRQIWERLNELKDPIQLSHFTQQIVGQCRFCAETEALLKEVAELSDKLTLNVYNFVTDTVTRDLFGADKIPATFFHKGGKERLGFYGIPTGYEFATLMEVMLRLSSGESGLSPDAKFRLAQVAKLIHIQVFVTPTCPYCPQAAVFGYQAAIENPNIRTDVIEISEFPHLAQKYGIMGVPKVVINETQSFEGALPEALYITRILEAIASKDS